MYALLHASVCAERQFSTLNETKTNGRDPLNRDIILALVLSKLQCLGDSSFVSEGLITPALTGKHIKRKSLIQCAPKSIKKMCL